LGSLKREGIEHRTSNIEHRTSNLQTSMFRKGSIFRQDWTRFQVKMHFVPCTGLRLASAARVLPGGDIHSGRL
jgi:hypothetical protein